MSNSAMASQDQATPFLTIQGTPIYFREDWATGIGGGLWSTGLAMAKYLEHHSDHALRCLDGLAARRPDSKKQLSLLELGSGNGFLAICFQALGKDRLGDLVITDTADHLALIQRTLDANSHIVSSSNKPVVMEHRWGGFSSGEVDAESIESCVQNGSCQFDVIIGSDVAYHERLYDPLIASLQRFCHNDTVALIGVTMNDTKPEFFHRLKTAAFRYERLADHLMEAEFRGTTFGIFVIQRQQ